MHPDAQSPDETGTFPVASDTQGDGQSKQMVWEVASMVGNENLVVEQIIALVQRRFRSERRLFHFQMAVAEAVRNAFEHGSQYDPERKVRLQVQLSREATGVSVHDQGIHSLIAEPADLLTKLTQQQTGRGWGLYLIKHLVDRWQFRNEPYGHVIELTMYHARDSDEREPE